MGDTTIQGMHNRLTAVVDTLIDEVRENAQTLAGKVDAVAGKGLSSNDYTAEDKAKVAGIEEGAQKTILVNEQRTTGGAYIFRPLMSATTCIHVVFLITPVDASLGFYLGLYEGQLNGVYRNTCIIKNGIDVTASNNQGSIEVKDNEGNALTSFNIKVYA